MKCEAFLVLLSLSHMVSRVRCGTWLYQFLKFAFFLTFAKHFIAILQATSLINSRAGMKESFYHMMINIL